MHQTHIDRTETGSKIPAPREPATPHGVCSSVRRAQAWTALDKARSQYAPRILAAAEDAVQTHYRPVARAIATDAGPAYGLSDAQAEQLADRGLTKAIRDCRSWDLRGFELYVRAAIESELRNAVTTAGGLVPFSTAARSSGVT